ncbi:MAG: alpha/beta hydrolase [Anaerolineae bacterium]|nr:alpha/beta hydrolase [Anaerolineae bacterium]
MTETGYVETNRGRLYYEVAGEGEALVFIHAGIADSSMWDPQVEVFQGQYRVIRYDTRGYGRSETLEPMPYSNRDDLRAVLDALHVEKAILVGCSRGGQIAVDFALEFPGRVRAIVPVCAGLRGVDLVPDMPADEAALFEEAEAAEAAGDWERVAEYDVRIWADGVMRGGTALEAVRDKVRQMCLKLYARGDDPGTPIPLEPPAGLRLGEIAVPTLIIVGAFDTSHARAAADVMAAGIAGARKVVIENSAHVPSMEHPELFNQILGEFLDSLPASVDV